MAYDKDLRVKAVEAVDGGASQRSVAKMLNIGLASLERWIKRKRETGSVEAISPPGARRKIDKAGEAKLSAYLKENPESKRSELCEYLVSQGYEQVSKSTMSRLLKAMDLSRKKTYHHPKRDEYARWCWRLRTMAVAIEKFVFIDESAVQINMQRDYAWSQVGTRAHVHKNRRRGKSYSLIADLSVHGIQAPFIVDGGVNVNNSNFAFSSYFYNLNAFE